MRSRSRRLALHGLLAVAVAIVLVDVVAAPTVARALGSLLTDPAHRLRDAHVVLRTAALVAALAWAFARFGFVALLATPLLVGPLFVAQLPPVTGDEPHYLMITASLDHDRDFAVGDNYARGDGAAFGYPRLDPHPFTLPYSFHYPGAAILALPGWVLGGRRWAVLGVAVFGVLLLHELWRLARVLGARPGPAALAAGMVTFSPPVLLMLRQAYPDIPGAFCLAHLARLLAEGERPGADGPDRPGRLPRYAAWTAAAVAFAAPWLHVRLLFGTGVLVGVLALRQRRLRWAPPLALVASLGLMAVVFTRWYGSPLPNAPYKDFPLRGANPLRGLVGVFADSHAGLVLVVPVIVVALVALPAVWRTSKTWLVAAGIVVAGTVAQTAAFVVWHLGYSTPGRPWTALLPLGTPLVARAIEQIPRVTAVAGAWTATLAVALLALPWFAYPDPNGLTGLWDHFGFTFLPVIDSPAKVEHYLNTPIVNCAAILAATAAVIAYAATGRTLRSRCAAPATRGGRWGRRRGSRSSWPA